MFLIGFFVIFGAFGQTFHVASNGSYWAGCGAEETPCATINQVFKNYPGESYTIVISVGAYGPYYTSPIVLERDAYVIFQGTENPVIAAAWDKDNTLSFINLTDTSGFEFHDLTITLTSDGLYFAEPFSNHVSFYNVILVYAAYTSNDFVSIAGGSLVISNVTFEGVKFDGYVVYSHSVGGDVNITIVQSTFSNLTIGDDGALLLVDGFGTGNVILDSLAITNVTADYAFIGVWGAGKSQSVSITNNIFTNIQSNLPNVYAENSINGIILIDNCTWIGASSAYVSGAVECAGPQNGDSNITLKNLKFSRCSGVYSGAVFVCYNSLNISNSSFDGNSGGEATDVIQGLDDESIQLGYDIGDSCSTSFEKRAIIWIPDDEKKTDISSNLPDCSSKSEPVPVPSSPSSRIQKRSAVSFSFLALPPPSTAEKKKEEKRKER